MFEGIEGAYVRGRGDEEQKRVWFEFLRKGAKPPRRKGKT
jgi:hypothetical protein